MSFFKDFKEDLSTAVNEMLPGEDEKQADYLEESAALDEDSIDAGRMEELTNELKNAAYAEPSKSAEDDFVIPTYTAKTPEYRAPRPQQYGAASEENAIITEGMTITGNLESTGSVEVRGTLNGDVRCNGKLVVTGVINGNTQSSEFFADNAKVTGEILADGSVKVGAGSVLIGNISATSAVIAGAVKGDIDVRGPVVADTSAIVMGNIKSRSVQINNGAVIEGFCSQCYSDVDLQNVFNS